MCNVSVRIQTKRNLLHVPYCTVPSSLYTWLVVTRWHALCERMIDSASHFRGENDWPAQVLVLKVDPVQHLLHYFLCRGQDAEVICVGKGLDG